VAGKPTPSYRRYEALIQLLRTANVVWEASRIFFARWDLSPSQFNVLNLIAEHPKGLSQSDLGRQLLMHRSNVTGLIDRLEKRGLVSRKNMSGDRRAYRVVLSGAGTGLLQQILPEYRERADHVWDGISPAKISSLLSTAERVSGNAISAVAESVARAPTPKAR
jgi:MarR family 2-MHQ and catechol resistance regulon transcriptional repressor